MAQITITLDSETEAIAVLELLKTMKTKSGNETPNTDTAVSDNEEPEMEKKTDFVKKSAAKGKKPAAPKETAPEESGRSSISLADVRAVALKLSKAGKQKQLKEIFAKYDAEKLSDIDTENYEALMTDLEAANE